MEPWLPTRLGLWAPVLVEGRAGMACTWAPVQPRWVSPYPGLHPNLPPPPPHGRLEPALGSIVCQGMPGPARDSSILETLPIMGLKPLLWWRQTGVSPAYKISESWKVYHLFESSATVLQGLNKWHPCSLFCDIVLMAEQCVPAHCNVLAACGDYLTTSMPCSPWACVRSSRRRWSWSVLPTLASRLWWTSYMAGS